MRVLEYTLLLLFVNAWSGFVANERSSYRRQATVRRRVKVYIMVLACSERASFAVPTQLQVLASPCHSIYITCEMQHRALRSWQHTVH